MEVLASVLSSAPTIRRGFVSKLAEITRWQVPVDLEQCQIILETERVIRDAKRIDLTVEIVRRSENGLERLAVWAFEAKVDSGINESLDSGGDEEKPLRNQLDFYSEWLKDASAEHNAGFVLGKSDLRAELPFEHRQSWRRLTWLGVAEFLKLAGSRLDDRDYERVLVESYYSFVRDYIGGVNMMGESEFKIDDVLFLRALYSIGDRTIETFDSMVSNLKEHVCKSKLVTRELTHQKALLGSKRRSVLMGKMRVDDDFPVLLVGVRAESVPRLFIVIETRPTHRRKDDFRRILSRKIAELNEGSSKLGCETRNKPRRTEWFLHQEPGWWDLEVNWSLEQFLSADNQTSIVRDLVSDAIRVLSESGVVEELRRI